jgi:hypothetical protein
MALAYLEKYKAVLNNETLNAAPPKLQKQQASKYLAWE